MLNVTATSDSVRPPLAAPTNHTASTVSRMMVMPTIVPALAAVIAPPRLGGAEGRGDSRSGPERRLFGMLQQGEGGACEALKGIGVTLQAARVEADLMFPSDLADVEPGRLPLSKAARDAAAEPLA